MEPKSQHVLVDSAPSFGPEGSHPQSFYNDTHEQQQTQSPGTSHGDYHSQYDHRPRSQRGRGGRFRPHSRPSDANDNNNIERPPTGRRGRNQRWTPGNRYRAGPRAPHPTTSSDISDVPEGAASSDLPLSNSGRGRHLSRRFFLEENQDRANSQGRGSAVHRQNMHDKNQSQRNFRLNSSGSTHKNTESHAEDIEQKGSERVNLAPADKTGQSGIVESQLQSNSFECMICCEVIRRNNPIWYCRSCYNIFHLKCSIEWCKKSIKSRNEAIEGTSYPSLGQQSANQSATINSENNRPDSLMNARTNSVEWPCPTCRTTLHSRPGQYKCFCGKVTRPEINKHLTPHSCGQICGRIRPNVECPHVCNSICHPGRCSACTLSSKRSCHCGKSEQDIKCSIGNYSCDQICGKKLTCDNHTCRKTCHSGSCGSCDETIILTCYCEDQVVEIECAKVKSNRKYSFGKFACDKVCDKMLDCGEHRCALKCHAGPGCPSCSLLSKNIKTCACGSTQVKKSALENRNSCTDPFPTCSSKCNKILICGTEKTRHKCQKKCHSGPCPPCKLRSIVRCECRQSTKEISCNEMYEKIEDPSDTDGQRVHFKQRQFEFSCESRCNKAKNCGRHRCSAKCCKFIKTQDSSLHKCELICGKKLACGSHNCQELCHPGQCGDCINVGWQELNCHCGGSVLYPPIPCGAKAPVCYRPCRRAHSCGHPVKHECHSDEDNCPPCTVFVSRSCFCGADSKDSVFCYQSGYSCGKTCKKLLNCRQHTCKRVCHDNDCETPNERGVKFCVQPCPVIRYSCKHPCGLSCHGKTACPSSECRKILEVSCECGNRKERVECFKIQREIDSYQRMAMMMNNRSDDNSVVIDLSKKNVARGTGSTGGEPKAQNSLKRLECDENCEILKRNKALAEALDIAQPDLKPLGVFGEDPLRLLKEATTQDYKFVSATYSSLAKLVKTAKESDKRFIFLQFPPNDKLRREMIHELAHHFNCGSESHDEEPFRHVVVRAYRNKSAVPDFTIEQLLPVDG